MKKARFAMFGVVLTAAVLAAVGTLLAQSGTPRTPPEPRERARVLSLDGRGSQIGVMVEDLSADELKGQSGARIEDVDQDSPAAKAGLREGDIVVEYDGERIRSARQFSRLVEETVDGRTVKLTFLRDGQRQTVDVTPEGRAFGWGLDSDRVGREIARGMRELEPRLREIDPRLREIEPRLRELEPRFRELEPRLREFQFDGPLRFDFGDMFPLGARRRLGVQIESLSPQLAEYFGVKDGGVLVSEVTKDSPAERAGIKAGDVITSIDGDRVRDYDDLIDRLRDKTGDVTIGIVRDKTESTIKATIQQPQQQPRTRRPPRPAI
jgi:serine protease Do